MAEFPENWDVVPFYDCFSMRRNNTCARAFMTNTAGSVQNIHYGDVLIKYGSVLPCDKTPIPYLTSEGEKQASMDYVADGDIIIADTAEDETVGKVVEVRDVGNSRIVSGLHTVCCRPVEGRFANGWLGYWMNSPAFHNQILPLLTGIKVLSVSKASLAKTSILVPPVEEQKTIAEALSSVDKHIDNLTRRIEKKRLVKQGVMQELLTGKKRLPGFNGEWRNKRLAEVATMFSGGTPPSSEKSYYGGDIPWVSISDITTSGKFLGRTEKRLTKLGLECCSARLFPPNSILFAMYASIGKCCIAQDSVSSSQAILGMYDLRGVELEYLYQVLVAREQEFMTMGQTGTQSNLSKQIVGRIEIMIPDTAEQHAIAVVLSDMDAEIAKLEAKRDKYIDIKQGMMNDLLTGKVRI